MEENLLDKVKIRLLREEDLPALEWDGEYRRYRKIYREVYRNSQKGISIPYVAETDTDGIIGQVFLTRKEPHPEYGFRFRYFFLSSFRIKPAFRDNGLGSRLLEICEKEVRTRHMRDICLNCSEENNRARRFYEKHGFRIIRKDEGDWTYINDEGYVVTEHQTAYMMKKTLPLLFNYFRGRKDQNSGRDQQTE